MKVICAWCKRFIEHKPGGPLVSHGICSRCAKEQADLMRSSQQPILQHQGAGRGGCSSK